LQHRQDKERCDHGKKWPERLQSDDVVYLKNRDCDCGQRSGEKNRASTARSFKFFLGEEASIGRTITPRYPNNQYETKDTAKPPGCRSIEICRQQNHRENRQHKWRSGVCQKNLQPELVDLRPFVHRAISKRDDYAGEASKGHRDLRTRT